MYFICSIKLYINQHVVYETLILFTVVSSAPQTAEIQTKKGTSKWIEISSDSEANEE